MPAYNFHPRFAEPILAGVKGGTIRAPRRPGNRGIHTVARQEATGGHAYVGEDLSLYTGMRTRQCRLIARKTCLGVERIALHLRAGAVLFPRRDIARYIDGAAALDDFARFDGFPDWVSLTDFWRAMHGDIADFIGWHIRWLPLPGGFGDG